MIEYDVRERISSVYFMLIRYHCCPLKLGNGRLPLKLHSKLFISQIIVRHWPLVTEKKILVKKGS